MNKEKLKVLIIEDDQTLLNIAEHQLQSEGYNTQSAVTGEDGLKLFQEFSPDIVITDLALEGVMNGDDVLKKVKAINEDTPVILMTAYGSVESAVECIKAGALDYITKPFRWDEMLLIVEKAINFVFLKRENKELRSLLHERYDFSSIIGQSNAMQNVIKQLPRITESDAPVLITGESGTGKELIAKAIHLNGPRKDGPFLAINCGAIPKELAESEFFGHVKGAFTGATGNKKGYFIEAEGGTLFLDEIGELSRDLQVKLLRALQEKEITPVGSAKATPVRVRIISATNVDLPLAIEAKEFREDLYYRISVLPMELPPLRKRKGDVLLLANHFLKKYGQSDSSLSAELLEKLSHQSWPGNIRELENLIQRMIILKPDLKEYHSWCLPEDDTLESRNLSFPIEFPEEGLDLDQVTQSLISSALHKTGGNQTQAAKLLGLSRASLIYRMQKYGLH